MPNLESLFERFEEDLVRRNCSAHTVQAYAADLRRFRDHFMERSPVPLSITDFDVMEFDVTKMREWVEGLHESGLGPSTIRRHIAALRAFFEFARKQGLISGNPAKKLRSPKHRQQLPPIMSQEKVATILDQVKSANHWNPRRDLAMLELLYGCGLRISELVGLDLADINLVECWLRVRGKGRKERDVPFGKKACKEALEEYLAVRYAVEGEEAVFVNKDGGRITDRGARTIVKGYGATFGGDASIHPHSFRHAYATHLLDNGADLRHIQKLLGHENPRATAIYTQVSLAKMVEVYDKFHPASR